MTTLVTHETLPAFVLYLKQQLREKNSLTVNIQEDEWELDFHELDIDHLSPALLQAIHESQKKPLGSFSSLSSS